MNIGQMNLGYILLFLSVTLTYHWYVAHLTKGMLVPELGVGVVSLYAVSLVLIIKVIKVK